MSSPDRKNGLIKPCCVMLDAITPKASVEFSAELRRAINERNVLTTKTRRKVTEALEEIQVESEEGSRRVRKQKILAEILGSEEKYIQQLEIIMKFFIKPAKDKGLLEPEDYAVLFGNVETIYKINKELLDELRKGPANVAKAFSKIAPFFKSYSFYAFEFKKSLEILQDCHKYNKKFAQFVEDQESRPEVQSKLSALLIAPIQRVPRYKLLIKPLFNLTSPSEEDYESLNDSLSKIENAAEHINKIIEERENTQRLIELQRCLQSGELNLIIPGRSLIKEGSLSKLNKDGHSQKLHVVLTNDIIMLCKMKNQTLKPKSLKCSLIYPLNKCKVVEILDKGSFRLLCEDNEVVLYNKSLSVTKEWIKEINCAINIYVEDRKSLRKENSTRRPAVKRKDIEEYNDVGVSPGKKLKKRRNPYDESEGAAPFALTCRRPIRNTLSPPYSVSVPSNSGSVPKVSSSSLNSQLSSSSSGSGTEIVAASDVFVFGRSNPDRGFSFRMNNWLCGVGSSFKNFFRFNSK